MGCARYPVFKETVEADAQFLQLMIHFSAVMNTIENQYLQYLDGNLSDETWHGFNNGLIGHITTREFFVDYWRFYREIHSPRFQSLVEELIPIAAKRRQQYAESIGFNETE